MASLLLFRDGTPSLPVPSPRPLAGTVIAVIISFATITILSCFTTQRALAVKAWSRLSLVTILVFAIYVDSWAFVFGSSIADYGIGIDSNLGVCSAAILLCLFFYVTTKNPFQFGKFTVLTFLLGQLIYIFQVEKAFLLQGGPKRRRVESKLYIFNLFGVLTIFAVICILTFVYRTAQMNKGRCIIGIEKQALIPLIVLEIVANVYIMALFLNPLWNVYSLKGASNAPANPPGLRPAAIRTFVGALFTTTSSIVNLIVLMVLNGEPGWIFFACCNADILFSTLIIQWVASGDDDNTIASSSPSNPPGSQATYRPSPRAPSLPSRRSQKLAISLPLKTTSTSQYEHIFGEIEPGTETDVVSTSSVSKHKAGSLRFDEDNDGFHTPIIYDGPEGDISDGARNERATSSIWTSPPPPSSARADAGADDRASGKSHTSTQPPTHESLSVSAAVAADLERIRRYRGRRTNWSSTTATTSTPPPPPTSTSITSRSHSPAPVPRTSRSRTAARGRGSVREYYISRLDFEEEGGGAGARWDELIQAEEEGRGENGEMVGWI